MKIIIVEDEYYARKALIKTIKTVDNSINILGDVENGKLAIDIIENEVPDVAFVDIRMPVMNGLELSKYINENYPDVIVIIISGHEDFKYAQSAINYGVKEYMLKPIDKNNIKKLLVQISDEIEKKKKNKRELEKLIKKAEELSLVIEENTLTKLAYGETENINILNTYESHLNTAYTCAVISTDINIDKNLKHSIEKYLNEISEYVLVHFLDTHDNRRMFIVYYGTELKNRFGYLCNSMLNICEKIRNNYNINVYIGISDLHKGINCFSIAMQEALSAEKYRILEDYKSLFKYSDIKNKKTYKKGFDLRQQKVLNNAMLQGEFEDIKKIINEVFLDIKKWNISLQSLQDMVNGITNQYNKVCNEVNDVNEENKNIAYTENILINNFTSLQKIHESLINEAERICIDINKIKNEKFSIIKSLKSFIDFHYNEDIHLAWLANNKYYVNPSYLSRLFKAEIGISFSGYLLEYRLKKSKELLRDLNLSISDVASIAGFNDVSYFIKMFKKYFNCTPGSYRNSL